MTTYYAAVKWPVGADKAEIEGAVRADLEILAMTLIEEHGLSLDDVEDIFERAVDAATWV